VIARYSQHTLLDGNLNVWPPSVHHCRSSIGSRRGRRTFIFLHLNTSPLFTASQSPRPSQSDSVASKSLLAETMFPVSRDRIAESKSALALSRPSRHSPSRSQVGISQHLASNSEPLHAFDPEIERTLHRLRKARHTITLDASSSNSIWNSENSNFTTDESIPFEHQGPGTMKNNDRTLKELATPDVVYQPWCIQCPPLEQTQSYELKSSLIHLLPKFHGLTGEDPHKHLKEFHVVCSTMRP
ncbi:hypothetical protein CR513_47448, partial [Mucuna pruriens]